MVYGVVEILLNFSANSVSVLCCFLPFMLFPAFYACSELSLAAAATKAYACCDKTFLTTNICRDKDNFVATNTSLVATKVCLSRQTRVCFCRNKNILSRQT